LLALRILRGARGWHFAAFGVTCGIAYLAKPSLLPFLLAFGAAFALRLIFALVRKDASWRPLPNLGGIAVTCGIFAVMLIPLALYTTEFYGKPLFNYTKYWMWMDDFRSEAYAFAVRNPGWMELEKLRPEEIPGPAWYFRRHTVREAFQRGAHGASEVAERFFFPESKLVWRAFFWRLPVGHWRQPLSHRGVYLLGFAALCLILAWPVRRTLLPRLAQPDALCCAALILMTGCLYTGLYGWYYPVGKGDRFMGSLWVPAVFLAVWAAFTLRRLGGSKRGNAVYLGVHGLTLFSLLLQIACVTWLFSQGYFLATQN